MYETTRNATLLIIPLLAIAADLPAQPARTFTLVPVRENLSMLQGEGGNIAVLLTDDGLVLVDNMFYRSFDGIRDAVAPLGDERIAFVLNTHQHDDHAGGNARFLELTDIVAHENVLINLSDIRQPYYEDTPGTPIGLPTITFSDRMTLIVGGQEIRAEHFGRGHTNGDAVVYFPALKTIHTGDLFLGRRAPAAAAAAAGRPPGVNIYVDYAQGGSFLEWTATLDAILALDFDTIIPGHGPVSTREDLVRFRADLAAMRDRIAALIAAGANKAQVLAVFESDYGWRSTGCPLSPPTPGCLQFQQMDALIAELSE